MWGIVWARFNLLWLFARRVTLGEDQYIDNVDELTLKRLHNQIEFEEVLDSTNSEIGQLTMDLEYVTFMTSGMK